MDHNRKDAIRMIDNLDEKSIGVTAFKSRCLALIDEVAEGKMRRVVLVKRNRPIAAVVPLGGEPPELWGAMRGTVKVGPRHGSDQGNGRGLGSQSLTSGKGGAARHLCRDLADEWRPDLRGKPGCHRSRTDRKPGNLCVTDDGMGDCYAGGQGPPSADSLA
jgi:antitoxin (DNA-binding transcriptional repressor) of toxin-antitoxin stability system